MEREVKRERRKRGELQVTFELLSGQEEVLTIHLLCSESQSFYTVKIDSQFIKNHSDMSSFFATPSSLMFTLNELFQQLKINSSGSIILQISLIAAKVNLTKIYEFKMNPWPEGELQYLRIRLIEQQQEFSVLMMQKQQEISSFRSKLQEQQDTITTLKKEKRQSQSLFRNLNEQNSQLKDSLTQSKRDLAHSRQINQANELKLHELHIQLDQKEELIQNIKNEELLVSKYQQKLFNCLYDANPQLYHFHYSYSSRGVKVIKKTENGWANFVCGWTVSQRQPSSFTLRMNRMRDGSLAVGVGSQAVMGCSTLEHPQFLGYLCRDGRIYQSGMRKTNGIPVHPDQTITVSVLKEEEGGVSWQVGGIESGTASLNGALMGKKLFLIVKVFWKDDEFELHF